MLFQDISIDVQPRAAALTDASHVLCFQPGQVLLGSKGGAPRLPLNREVEPLLPPDMEWTALLTVDGQAIDGCVLPVFADGKTHQVKVTLG